jgi:hypothetical protein
MSHATINELKPVLKFNKFIGSKRDDVRTAPDGRNSAIISTTINKLMFGL